MSELRLENLHKRFGRTPVIQGVDLRVEAGELCVILGPSGCGKSTLLRLIAGLEAADAGAVVSDVPAGAPAAAPAETMRPPRADKDRSAGGDHPGPGPASTHPAPDTDPR